MATSPINPATRDELDAVLPSVLAAPAERGTVRLLCVRPEHNVRSFPDRIKLGPDQGVEGDFEMSQPWLQLPDGRPDPRIQVAIMSWRVLETCWRDRDRVTYPGETIVADMNLTEQNLPPGTVLLVGSARLRVSDVPNAGCAKWKVRCGTAAYDWTTAASHAHLRLRGLFCSIDQGGEIGLGDTIRRA